MSKKEGVVIIKQYSNKLLFRMAAYFLFGTFSLLGLASESHASAGGADVTNMTEGVISYSYDITDGTESHGAKTPGDAPIQ
jgi:hypothetical protein